MTAATLSDDLRVYARRRWPLDNDKRRKERLATLLNFTQRRVRSLWQGEGTARPRGEEIEQIEALIGVGKEAADEADRALEARFAALEAEIAALRAALAGRAMDTGGSAGGGRG